MISFKEISLKNKIFFSTLAMVLVISATIALLARWILISSLVNELTGRGIAIAQSIADQGRGYVLTRDHANLVSLIFDAAQLGERRMLVEYIFIVDDEQNVLANTLIRPFPEELRFVNPIPPERNYSIAQLTIEDASVYDIAVPVWEGIYTIGTVHVGLKQRHIDQLIGKLRITFLGFIFAIFIIIFLISHKFSKYVTKSLTQLTRIADDITQGNLDVKPLGIEEMDKEEHCPAYYNTDLPCWYVDKTLGRVSFDYAPEKPAYCTDCLVKKKKSGDEVQQLADSFKHMVRSIKLYRNRVRESEEKYRSLFRSGPAPIFVLSSRTFRILDANPSALATYDYTKEEMLKTSFLELAPEFKSKFSMFFNDHPGAESFIYPKAMHFKKGEVPFYVNVVACRTRYLDREAIIVSTSDITEMLEKDAQLIQASKMTSLGQLSAGIAHELNQPLNMIKMGSEFLDMAVNEKTPLSDESLRQISNEMSAQVDRATEIINHLREFGRKSDFTKEPIDINKPVRGVLSIMMHQLSLQNIVVTLDLNETLPPILAHVNRLEQVLFNLVTNARDAIMDKYVSLEEDGRREIMIRSFQEHDRVCLSVTDSGCGMSDKIVKKIFDPFFTTKQTGMGMGLGLSISYGIIKDYDGTIEIKSEEGNGTTFILTFPVADQ
ncbi:histidine kinase [Desulfonatronum thiosulfatophilum]|uniref:histidine kinase n=1 Tax=Desulfonatronum thiosulfatophilum TaxID=617002 RepID=A0A1G6EDE2_9BACT|nr:ATP-binding protein [Desulfonatronum thiosulfatophilum]SDB55416.1 histidine kinase [Desulfonatronum thiosulfatophilum]